MYTMRIQCAVTKFSIPRNTMIRSHTLKLHLLYKKSKYYVYENVCCTLFLLSYGDLCYAYNTALLKHRISQGLTITQLLFSCRRFGDLSLKSMF